MLHCPCWLFAAASVVNARSEHMANEQKRDPVLPKFQGSKMDTRDNRSWFLLPTKEVLYSFGFGTSLETKVHV